MLPRAAFAQDATPQAYVGEKITSPTREEWTKAFEESVTLVAPEGPGGIFIDSAVADGPQSVILNQVTYGIAVRMAVMSIVAGASA